jgi:hypothetical protein
MKKIKIDTLAFHEKKVCGACTHEIKEIYYCINCSPEEH